MGLGSEAFLRWGSAGQLCENSGSRLTFRSMECPFCTLSPSRMLARSPTAVAFRDAYPISPGHTLIVPLRHVGSFFALRSDEQSEILALLNQTKRQLDEEFHPDAYNIGVNDGVAAGQTIAHVHIHLIPRYGGDCADPRGGVRWIVPGKADYWTPRGNP